MTRDIKPSIANLWQLVERYGSLTHAANAIGVEPDELRAWLKGAAAVPQVHYERLLRLLVDRERKL